MGMQLCSTKAFELQPPNVFALWLSCFMKMRRKCGMALPVWNGAAFFGIACLAVLARMACSSAFAADVPTVQGIDHMSVAVTDLDRAKQDFARLGFTLKPGRTHDNGIRNAHAKFAGGGYIELITANHPTDPLATEYANWLKGGDGAIFWCLYAPDLGTLATRLSQLGLSPAGQEAITFSHEHMPHRVFFSDRPDSPTDQPKYFVHPNTAYRLAGIWLSAAESERALLKNLGAKQIASPQCTPFDTETQSLQLAQGETVGFVTEHRQAERAIVGASILVRQLSILTAILDRNHVVHKISQSCGHASVWVYPSEVHGMWLEFRQHS